MSQTFGASRFDAIVDKSITEIRSNAPSIGQYAFCNCTQLTSAKFPKATSIGTYAFSTCSGLASINIPICSLIDTNAFYNCVSLVNIHLNSTVTINNYAFRNCSGLTSFFAPKASIKQYVFQGCSQLDSVVIYSTDGYSFGLYNCSISKTDIKAGAIAANYFSSCPNLQCIILRSSSRLNLGNVNAFSETPFASGGTGGTVYIPKVLYDELGTGSSLDYKAAANWSTVDGYGTITWAQIEGSRYENYYADGTPIT